MSRRRRIAPILALAAAGLVGSLGLAGCGGGGKKGVDSSTPKTVTLKTNEGTFAFSLDAKDSPNTTESFAKLVEKGFFDGTIFHRIVPGFVIQGGDPTGSGTGGPGYSTVDVPPADTKYTKGVVAMAKAGSEPPGTAGSQFFVVTADDAHLSPDYALLGRVTSGLDVVEKIGRLGDPATEKPTKRIVIERAALTEG
jgi:peptidyl-prolyl cis-trans isomerase B (cyclophilin B)